MPWWAIVLTVLGAMAFFYLFLGSFMTVFFLRRKMRTEEKVRERERKAGVPDETFSYPFTEATLVNKRGLKMFARVFIAEKPTDKWVLMLHGYASNGISMIKYGKMFNEFGYNAVAPDFCHCGRSEGKFLSFGWYEREDAAEWLEYIKERYAPSQLGVFGVSMGAATGIHMAASRKDIDFLIPYCSYSSYKRIVMSKGRDFTHIPFFNIWWPLVNACTSVVAGKTQGAELDVSRDLGKVSCPTLLLHSKKDNFTDYRNSVDMYEANKANGNIRLHLFEEGLHARAFATDPAEYTRVVGKFIDEVNNGNSEEKIKTQGE